MIEPQPATTDRFLHIADMAGMNAVREKTESVEIMEQHGDALKAIARLMKIAIEAEGTEEQAVMQERLESAKRTFDDKYAIPGNFQPAFNKYLEGAEGYLRSALGKPKPGLTIEEKPGAGPVLSRIMGLPERGGDRGR